MSGPIDAIEVLRKASRSVPNEDFVAFDDAIFALVVLIEATARVIASDDAHESLHAPDGDDIARMVEYAHAFEGLRAALANVGGAS